ncbi:MAG: hypothetical protein K5852_08305 [Eubacterium sp.]|nr:hypothetical protein [Eubacterium sp.]
MKKTGIIIVNMLIMIALLSFVVLYSRYTSRNALQRQIEHFENTTITMEQVTENYLEGEQRICDVWAHYINSQDMDVEDAVSFIRISHVLPNASAHIVYRDTLAGLSTRPRLDDPDDYSVSYARTGLLNDASWIHDIGGLSTFPVPIRTRSTGNSLLSSAILSRFMIRRPVIRRTPYCCVCCRCQSWSRNGFSRRKILKTPSFP